MTLDEYKNAINLIDEKTHKEKLKAGKEYALSNNAVQIGDVIEDHIGKIMVETINIHYSAIPQCVYYGTEYRKDGIPKKSCAKRHVYQSNLIKKLS